VGNSILLSRRPEKISQDSLAISFVIGFISTVTFYFAIPTDPLFEWIVVANALLIIISLGWVQRWGWSVGKMDRLNVQYLSVSPLFLFVALLVMRQVILSDVNSASFALLSGSCFGLSVWATMSLHMRSASEQSFPVVVGKISVHVALFCLLQFIFDAVDDHIFRTILVGVIAYCLTEIYFRQLNQRSDWRYSGVLTGTIAAQLSLLGYFLPFSNSGNGVLTFSAIYLVIALLENLNNENQQGSVLFAQVVGVALLAIWILS
jgi:hypothetical protein